MVFLTFKDSIVGSINWQTSCLIFFPKKKVFKLILPSFSRNGVYLSFILNLNAVLKKKFLKCAFMCGFNVA